MRLIVSLTIPNSSEIQALYVRIFSKLESTFSNHVVREYSRSVDAMRLVALLGNKEIAQGCYSLFHVVLSSSFDEGEIWAAARLAGHGAYKWDQYLPWVNNPDDALKFLLYHFAIQAEGGDDVAMQPIEDMLRAIAYASNDKTLEGFKKFDFTDKVFVGGIRKAVGKDRPFQTRKATLFLLPMVQDKWFDDSLEDVMSDEEKNEFSRDWGSIVDGIQHVLDVKKAACATFYAMLNSKRWRSHIAKDKFKLIVYFAEIPDNSKHFMACKKNASVFPWLLSRVEEAGSGGAEATNMWKMWLAILWSDYASLSKEVKNQVLEVTKVVTSKAKPDITFVSGILAMEKENYRVKLGGYAALSLEDEAERLRARVEDINESIERFEELVGKKAM